jgi:hypothetical protein
MTDFFEVLENNKLASDEFIKRDVTKEINKLFERNMQNVKEIGKDYTYNKYRKKSTVSYVILGIGAILLLYFSSRISSAGFKANLPFFITGLLFTILGLVGMFYYTYKANIEGKERLDVQKKAIQITEDEYKEIIGTESVIASGFIILFEKKQLFLDCYFYPKKNYLAFCDGSYIYEIRLDMLLIKKTTDKLVFKDPFFDYSNTNITKNKKGLYESTNNYDIIVEGKNKLLLRMTEYHFNKIKDLLGDLDDK